MADSSPLRQRRTRMASSADTMLPRDYWLYLRQGRWVSEVRSQESGVRGQESGVRSQGSGVRGQESGVRSQGSGVRGQESGVRSQGSGVRSQGRSEEHTSELQSPCNLVCGLLLEENEVMEPRNTRL